jgi:hypothetical protein
MDKKKLLDVVEKFTARYSTVIPKELFMPLLEDPTDWQAWNQLHALSIGYSIDRETVRAIRECTQITTRNFLGDVA